MRVVLHRARKKKTRNFLSVRAHGRVNTRPVAGAEAPRAESRERKGRWRGSLFSEEATRKRVVGARSRGWAPKEDEERERGVSQRLAATSPISHRRLKTTGPLHLPRESVRGCIREEPHFIPGQMEWLTCMQRDPLHPTRGHPYYHPLPGYLISRGARPRISLNWITLSRDFIWTC